MAAQEDISGFNAIQINTYPNPFRGKTTIEFVLDNDEEYTLEIYDLRGSRVEVLPSGKARAV